MKNWNPLGLWYKKKLSGSSAAQNVTRNKLAKEIQCHTTLNSVISANGDSLLLLQEKTNMHYVGSHMSLDNSPTLSALWESEKRTC